MKNKTTMDKIFRFSKKFLDKKKVDKIVKTIDDPFVYNGYLFSSDGVCFLRHVVDDCMACGIYDTNGNRIKPLSNVHSNIATSINRYIDQTMIPSNYQQESDPIIYDSIIYTDNFLEYPWFNVDIPSQGGIYEEVLINKIKRSRMITHDYYYRPNNPLIVGNIDNKACVYGIMHIKINKELKNEKWN